MNNRPHSARKNVSIIYETADTRFSSNYLTLGGNTNNNKLIQDRKTSESGLDHLSRDPLDVLLPNDIHFGALNNG